MQEMPLANAHSETMQPIPKNIGWFTLTSGRKFAITISIRATTDRNTRYTPPPRASSLARTIYLPGGGAFLHDGA